MSATDTTEVQLVNGLSCSLPADSPLAKLLKSQRTWVGPDAKERLKILRAAFAATMQDKEFLADAERTRIDVVPTTGEKVQQMVEQLYATPGDVIETIRKISPALR